MGVERLSAVESAKLIAREPIKYGGLVAGMYLLSVKDYEIGKTIRAHYLFLRHIDDYLDEGQQKPGKLFYVLNIRDKIESRKFIGKPKIAELAKYALEVLEKKARPDDNPRQDFLAIIDSMVFDYERGKERRVLGNEALNDYYHNTFFPTVNLTLMSLESRFRAIDIPALSYSYGRVYSVRDLEEDWQRGVINIPREILQEAWLTQFSSIADLKRNPIVKQWLLREVSESLSALIATKIQLQRSSERITPILCNGVIKTASKLITQYYNNNHSLGGIP